MKGNVLELVKVILFLNQSNTEARAMTQPNKANHIALRDGWDKVIADAYQKLPDKLKQKVRLEQGRLHFTVKGVGAATRHIGADTKFLGCNISQATRDVLMQPGYDEEHQLIPGAEYNMVLCYGAEIAARSDRTSTNIRNLMMTEFGDSVNVAPEAEFVFLVRRAFTDAELRMLSLEYMAVPHSRIEGGETSNQLLSRQKGGDLWVQPWVIDPNVPWEGNVGFAFPFL